MNHGLKVDFSWDFLMVATATGAVLLLRPLVPIDETRYVSVAWEMWNRHDLLVPFLNGAPYSDKPPLLFWIMQALWGLFGVNYLAPRLISPFFAVLNLLLIARITSLLNHPGSTVSLSRCILAGSFLWIIFETAVMFDVQLTFFVQLSVLGIVTASRRMEFRGFSLMALGIGGGILTKGPVTLIHVLPLAFLMPLWAENKPGARRWYSFCLISLVIGTGLALAWAVPASIRGGSGYADAIIWNQTADRMVRSFAHGRAWWWYLPLLPLAFLPWACWGATWKGIRRIGSTETTRFCLSWLLPPLIMLSFISGKQVHYLIPILPAISILAACRIDNRQDLFPSSMKLAACLFFIIAAVYVLAPFQAERLGWMQGRFLNPWWGIPMVAIAAFLWVWKPKDASKAAKGLGLSGVLLLIFLLIGSQSLIMEFYDVRPMAGHVASIEKEGKRIAHYSKYNGQYHFAGRLQNPFEVVRSPGEARKWVREHRDSFIITYYTNPTGFEEKAEFAHHYEKKISSLWSTDLLIENPAMMRAVIR